MRPVGGSATEASDGGVGALGGKSGGVAPEDTAKTGVRVASAAGQMVRGRGGHHWYRRKQKHGRRISRWKQKGRQPSYVARVCENCEDQWR